ncbi:hypothetical protein EXIGLDRAFT_201093 [Exidia glandulosa HHB12029]|uniref:Uncharacterized protein n=1 Tax=Exidia glandulosa HHB12029 TaxID=1314781 RepID=A0A166A0Q9_EXIGL|nr:hypothetical protein EXIGLDRAFT_201093 [Exidia glandulosa HHB12029]
MESAPAQDLCGIARANIVVDEKDSHAGVLISGREFVCKAYHWSCSDPSLPFKKRSRAHRAFRQSSALLIARNA